MKMSLRPLAGLKRHLQEVRATTACWLFCLFNDWYTPILARDSHGKVILVAAYNLRSTRHKFSDRVFYTAFPTSYHESAL